MQWNFKGRKGDTYTKITSSTVETPIIPAFDDGGNATRVNVYGLILTNSSATVNKVTIRHGLGGGVKMVVQVPVTDTKIIMLPEGHSLEADASNTPWTATCGTSLDSMEITALFTKD